MNKIAETFPPTLNPSPTRGEGTSVLTNNSPPSEGCPLGRGGSSAITPEDHPVRLGRPPLQERGINMEYPSVLQTSQIKSALAFLEGSQSSSNQPFPGSFVCCLNQSNGSHKDDWTVFNTALTVQRLNQLLSKAPFNYSVLGGESLPVMIQSASSFLNHSQHNIPAGSFSFWPLGNQYQAKPDLDDTALALSAVHADFYKLDAYGVEVLPHTPTISHECSPREIEREDLKNKAWELFSPYRYSRGMTLAMQSHWAEAYPGVFSTWIFQEPSSKNIDVSRINEMSSDTRREQHSNKVEDRQLINYGNGYNEPVVIDAIALAHICHYLLDIGSTDIPGLGESLTLLSKLLSHCSDRIQSTASLKEVMQSLPLAQWMPYYRSLPHFLSACAALSPLQVSSHYLSPKIAAIHEKVSALLVQSLEDDFSNDFTSQLWLWDAAVHCNLTLSSKDLSDLAVLQQADGGWPEIEICTDLQGDWRWTSRTVSTAIALNLLSQHNGAEKISIFNE